jgi:diguanylate cyclase (GGDEF)-like protein
VNRRGFDEILPVALARVQRAETGLALLFFDLDHFKSINDTHGHATGDAVLCEFARRLTQGVRATDTVARLAGDEFVILLENVRDRVEPPFVAEKLLDLINEPFDHEGKRLAMRSSIGIALYLHPEPLPTPTELLTQADRVMYAAKMTGRNTYKMSV